ncbi:MAG: DNA repair protein RadC [Candidatus Pacebacteria bacterium]|nr:DNA repair protein RadC [Candidatus Paceibacterota bacterium]MCF7862755.1 DNA repair protein RadC [Candidatus Paceibacterota bacterium]
MSYSYYVVKNHDILLDSKDKPYYLKVRDLPEEEKPREKLLKHGPTALSISELLAVILNTGTKKEGLLEMSHRIIKNYGEGGIMSEKSPKNMAENLDIPLGKATQIVACAELGRRFFQKNESTLPVVRTAREVYEYVQDMHHLSKEHLRGIYLNAHYKVIHDEVISIGTVDGSIIHPREVFKPAIERSAVALILVHNHPSGETTPSEADIAVTKQLVEAGKLLGVDLIDHIIVTKNAFASISANYQ